MAETSLTIPGLRYVIDSGLINQEGWNPALAAETLTPEMHSRSGVRQRWGRVGRETYGWVFPLYGKSQFEGLKKDTPAGSTTSNLEPVILKLASAGVTDLRSLRFPANFDTSTRDTAGQKSAATFTAELERTQRVLKAAGALHDNGDITSLGVELDNSRLPTERTMALLFADRLACVPEVALALVALDAGSFVGRGRLLRHEHSWPAAYAVHARRCHEALAVGCEDDLDFILRLFMDWEAADSPGEWADRWWVDADTMELVYEESRKLIDNFAPGMSEEARRPLDLRLTDRVRAVLSRALTSLRFRRDASGGWRVVDSTAADLNIGLAPERLVEPSSYIISLKRDRPHVQWGVAPTVSSVLYGTVNVLDWATSEDLDPFGLMIAARDRLRPSNGELPPVDDPLKVVRQRYPVGTKLRVRLRRAPGGGLLLADHAILQPGLAFSEAVFLSDEEAAKRADASRSSNYSGVPRRKSETSGEIRSSPIGSVAGAERVSEDFRGQPRDIRTLEVEYDLPAEPVTSLTPDVTGSVRDAVPIEILVECSDRNTGLAAYVDTTIVVVGYSLGQNGGPVLMVEVISETAENWLDPAFHDDLQAGDPVKVVAGGVVRSHFVDFRILHRCDDTGLPDGRGSFFYDGPLLDEWDVAGSASIHAGSRWDAVVTATGKAGEYQGLTILHELWNLFVDASGLRPRIRGRAPQTSLSGTVVAVDVANIRREPSFIVQLILPSAVDFDSRVFVPMEKLRDLSNPESAIGSIATVQVGPKLTARRSGRWSPEDVQYLVEESSGLFTPDKKEGNFRLSTGDALTPKGLEILLRVDPNNSDYAKYALLLWESSRRIGVIPRSEVAIDQSSIGRVSPTRNSPAANAESKPRRRLPKPQFSARTPIREYRDNAPGPRTSPAAGYQQPGDRDLASVSSDALQGRPVAGRGKVYGSSASRGTAYGSLSRPVSEPTPVVMPKGDTLDPSGVSIRARNTDVEAPPLDVRYMVVSLTLVLIVAIIAVASFAYIQRNSQAPKQPSVSSFGISSNQAQVLMGPDSARLYVVGKGLKSAGSSLSALDATKMKSVAGPVAIGPAALKQNATLSRDGSRIYFDNTYSGGQRAQIGYVETINLTKSIVYTKISNPGSIVASPNGERVYVGDPSGVIVVLGRNLDRLYTIRLPVKNPSRIVPSADGRQLYILAQSRVCIVDTIRRTAVCRGPLSPNVQARDLLEMPGRSGVLVLTDTSLFVLDPHSLQGKKRIDAYENARWLGVSGDGRRLMVREVGALRVLDAASYNLVWNVELKEAADGPDAAPVVANSDGSIAYTTGGGNVLLKITLP